MIWFYFIFVIINLIILEIAFRLDEPEGVDLKIFIICLAFASIFLIMIIIGAIFIEEYEKYMEKNIIYKEIIKKANEIGFKSKLEKYIPLIEGRYKLSRLSNLWLNDFIFFLEYKFNINIMIGCAYATNEIKYIKIYYMNILSEDKKYIRVIDAMTVETYFPDKYTAILALLNTIDNEDMRNK